MAKIGLNYTGQACSFWLVTTTDGGSIPLASVHYLQGGSDHCSCPSSWEYEAAVDFPDPVDIWPAGFYYDIDFKQRRIYDAAIYHACHMLGKRKSA